MEILGVPLFVVAVLGVIKGLNALGSIGKPKVVNLEQAKKEGKIAFTVIGIFFLLVFLLLRYIGSEVVRGGF